jgi:hypothetical protein
MTIHRSCRRVRSIVNAEEAVFWLHPVGIGDIPLDVAVNMAP